MDTMSGNGVPINIGADIFNQIDGLAKQQHVRSELLINKILEQYISKQAITPQSSSAEFLLSIQGMFDTGENTTSERVKEVVKGLIRDKHAK
jgi:hypothetical protein